METEAVPTIDALVTGATSADVHNGGDAALDDLSKILTEEETSPLPTRPRRGRPRKSKGTGYRSKREIEAELAQKTAELDAERARANTTAVNDLAQQVEMICALTFGLAASKRGAHWALTPEERERIGQTGALALAPYAEPLRKYAPWSMFAACLGSAVYARWEIDVELSSKARAPLAVA